MVRCYKFLEFGHYESESQVEDKKETCLKCGKRDHRPKDCSGITYCLSCKSEGHRADQTKYPNYTSLIREKAKDLVSGNPKKGKTKEYDCSIVGERDRLTYVSNRR